MSGGGPWQPIDVFSPNAVDLVLIARDLPGVVRKMREELGAYLRSEGRSAAMVDRTLERAETKVRATYREQAELEIASVKARLLEEARETEAGEQNGQPA